MTKHYTISEISTLWLKQQESILKQTSYIKYESILRNYIIPKFGMRSVSSLSKNEIRIWADELHRNGGMCASGLAPKTVNSIISVLRLLCLFSYDYFGEKPVNFENINIRQRKTQIEILSHNEQQLLEAFLLNNMNLSNLGILACLYTGLRLGEICALRWGDINQAEGVMYIHSTMVRVWADAGSKRKTKIIITPPKSDSSIRFIPIPNRLLEIIERSRNSDETFFLTGNQMVYVDPRTMENRFKSVQKKSGINPVKFHVLRHTFATRCVENDFDVKSLSEILGHASINITLNRYVHPTMVKKREYMNRLFS